MEAPPLTFAPIPKPSVPHQTVSIIPNTTQNVTVKQATVPRSLDTHIFDLEYSIAIPSQGVCRYVVVS